MATFPPRMKFPRKGRSKIKPGRIGDQPFDFLQEFTCEGHQFVTIIGDKDFLKRKVYYFSAAHIIIPKYFSKVIVHPKTGEVLDESAPALGIEINALFAVSLRRPKPGERVHLLDTNALYKRGDHNCGSPTASNIDNEVSTSNNIRIVRRPKSNVHQLFFKFHNHYFTPIILSNGMICYHIFERKKKIKKWVKKLNSKKEYEIAINGPIRIDNTLRVPIIRKAKLHKKEFKRLR